MGKKVINVEVRPKHEREHPEKMIKRFMKKVKNSKVLEIYRERMRYEKPSDKKRKQRAKRKKVLEKLHNEKIKQLGN
jgi:ribosomal protein S21